eukprot:3675782-Lingulodinium_polyedra.AAC.1
MSKTSTGQHRLLCERGTGREGLPHRRRGNRNHPGWDRRQTAAVPRAETVHQRAQWHGPAVPD